MKLDLVKQLKLADSETFRKGRLSDRVAMLGIPDAEMTESVKLAVSALLEKLEDMGSELVRTKESLSEMERLVDVDLLAPIPNRRAFMRRLAWAITMHERYGHPSTILYIDVNDFKQINDLHGHAAGDLAIRHIADLLTNAMRESDFLARIGGDEFAVIMYHADEEDARKRAVLITQKILHTPLVFAGKPITVACAHGCYSIRNGDNAESALAAADMSMYVDKKRTKARTA